MINSKNFPENGQILDITEKELFNEISFSAISRGIIFKIYKKAFILVKQKLKNIVLMKQFKLQLRII